MDAHEPALLEIVLESADLFHLDGRDAVEDPLHEALTAAGIGEVTGGGSGMGKSTIDVEVSDLEAGLGLVRRVLRDLKVAASTVIYAQQGDQAAGTDRITAYPVYEQPRTYGYRTTLTRSAGGYIASMWGRDAHELAHGTIRQLVVGQGRTSRYEWTA